MVKRARDLKLRQNSRTSRTSII